MVTKEFEAIPGGDLVAQGLVDLAEGRASECALLVSIGEPRLRRLGIVVPSPLSSPEHRLYEQLAREHGDGAHSKYNSLLRRLASFARALECGL